MVCGKVGDSGHKTPALLSTCIKVERGVWKHYSASGNLPLLYTYVCHQIFSARPNLLLVLVSNGNYFVACLFPGKELNKKIFHELVEGKVDAKQLKEHLIPSGSSADVGEEGGSVDKSVSVDGLFEEWNKFQPSWVALVEALLHMPVADETTAIGEKAATYAGECLVQYVIAWQFVCFKYLTPPYHKTWLCEMESHQLVPFLSTVELLLMAAPDKRPPCL